MVLQGCEVRRYAAKHGTSPGSSHKIGYRAFWMRLCGSRPLQADLGATVGYASLLTAPSPATAFDRADLAMLARKPSRRV